MITQTFDPFFQHQFRNTGFISKMCLSGSEADFNILHAFFLQKSVDGLRTGAATHSFYLPVYCFHVLIIQKPVAKLPNSNRMGSQAVTGEGIIFDLWNGLIPSRKLMRWPGFSGKPSRIPKFMHFT